MGKEEDMNIDIHGAVKMILNEFEKNARLREQNAILSCALIVTSIGWGVERYRRLHNKKTNEGE